MDYFTCLFPYEQLNFKSNKANYCFQIKWLIKKYTSKLTSKKVLKQLLNAFLKLSVEIYILTRCVNKKCLNLDLVINILTLTGQLHMNLMTR